MSAEFDGWLLIRSRGDERTVAATKDSLLYHYDVGHSLIVATPNHTLFGRCSSWMASRLYISSVQAVSSIALG